MANQSKLESEDGLKPQTPADIRKEQVEVTVDHGSSTATRPATSRRAGLSKREIMEELSRQRFPWDE
jgi:hypothetical protein